MGLISAFVDAVKKAFGRTSTVDIEEVRASGGLGSTSPTDAFDPLRPAGRPTDGPDVRPGPTSVASGDPEEGGEISEPHSPTMR